MLEGLCIFMLPPLLSLLFYPGTSGKEKKVMINFNKNKIKMIKPFISFRDNLSSAGWSNLEENKCKPGVAAALPSHSPRPPPTKKQTEKVACGQIFKIN